jgi:TolB-like protein
MSSIIEGYNYDIFVSYRQKDNKGDRWVSEFVEALKTELESTFKEEISVYFDINPHDGLLETHDVDESLKEKLKCLVFIPIISRTYCDPKSFAWEHEFKAFIYLAANDPYGLKIKVSGSNVMSRVLPVQIHDLNPEDRKLVEDELGGFLRGIEFIYKEPGVNRPLASNDDEKKNQNGTKYKNQVNKVANSVSQIIDGLKNKDHSGKVISDKLTGDKPTTRKILNKKIIATSLSLLLLIVAGYFVIAKLIKPKEQPEKSIAVLPFFNDSKEQENTYFINGIMEEILNNLQKVKEFKVLSRTSTEKFRDSNRPSISEIGKELDVNYIVEGSGQKYGDSYRLRVQLIEAKNDKHLWAESFEKEIRETKVIYGVQSQIAQTIAAELKAIITPEEKQLIEQTPTLNLTAYDFYQRGKEEHQKYWSNNDRKESLEKAEDLYKKAIENDPGFAQAYVGLAWVFWNKHYWSTFFNKNFLDTIPVLADIALSHDDKLSEAYLLKGSYYQETGNMEQAEKEYDKCIKYNKNDWRPYYQKSILYGYDDLVKVLDNSYKAAALYRGPQLPQILKNIFSAYHSAGFPEKSKYVAGQFLKLTNDSAGFYFQLSLLEEGNTKYQEQLKLLRKVYAIDSTYNFYGGPSDILFALGACLSYNGQHKESLQYFKRHIERLQANGKIGLWTSHRFAYEFWINGYREKADYYFKKQLEYGNSEIKLGRLRSDILFSYYDIAGVYAFLGEKGKAYENLRIFSQKKSITRGMIILIKKDPLFDSIRNEPEFQKIVRDLESKWQAEHERVRQWLEENNML